MKHQKRQW